MSLGAELMSMDVVEQDGVFFAHCRLIEKEDYYCQCRHDNEGAARACAEAMGLSMVDALKKLGSVRMDDSQLRKALEKQ